LKKRESNPPDFFSPKLIVGCHARTQEDSVTVQANTRPKLRRFASEKTETEESTNVSNAVRPVALQCWSQFVGRTTNWLYDHLRHVPRHNPVVLCNTLLNRSEFPELQAWCLEWGLVRRVWRRATENRLYPAEWRRLRRLTPCVIHSHFGGEALQDYGLQRIVDVPWLVSFYGADVYEGSAAERQEKYARLFDNAARVLALGPAMKKQLERLGCPEKKIVVHPLGVDIEKLPAEPRILKRGEPLKVLFAGTFREKKGVQYLIEATSLARRAGVRLKLDLVGDSAEKEGDREAKEEIFTQIHRAGLNETVTHHGYVSFRELLALALRSHVFSAPSVTARTGDAEGTPFVLQQMMATAMPVISTLHSDIPYLFGDHTNLLVPERDAHAIADRLEHYADDPDSLVTDGVALRDQIRASFDVRKCAARLSDLYDAVGRL
jgi:colanic acid/amylovoran biosynthesis glycosyltransferase